MIALPPAIFDHAYAGPVIERRVSAAEVERMCRVTDAEACTLFRPNFAGDTCFIITPVVGIGGVSQSAYELLRRHEIGHCNGWSDKHEDAQ